MRRGEMQDAKCRMPVSGRHSTARGAFCILHCALLSFALGCSVDKSPASSPSTNASTTAPHSREALRPVALPDLSRLSPSVQKQLRNGYAALTAKMNSPGVTDSELAHAYGEMGKLL